MSVGPKTTLILKRRTATADGMGGYTFVWGTVRSIRGVFAPLSDRERMMYGKKAEGAEYKFTLDYLFGSDVTTKDRFYDSGTRLFEIVSKQDPMEQHRFTVFLLSENVNG
jgi:head-tail adaptor